jgi:hypothetical protein
VLEVASELLAWIATAVEEVAQGVVVELHAPPSNPSRAR